MLLLWDYSNLDLVLAHWFGSASGFALESHWLWRYWLHDDVRLWPWVLELYLLVGMFVPLGALKRLPMERRAQLALTTLAALLLVSTIKAYSHTSCPRTCKTLAASQLACRIGPGACATEAPTAVFQLVMHR